MEGIGCWNQEKGRLGVGGGGGGEVMGKTKGGKKREEGKWDPPCVRKWRENIVGLF